MKLSNDRVEELLDMEAKLEALESGGVNNWDGYHIALAEYRKSVEVKEKIAVIFDDLVSIISNGLEEGVGGGFKPAGMGTSYGISPDARIEALNLLQNSVIPK